MRSITLDEFQNELIAQGVGRHSDVAFKCPMCGTIQSARDFIKAGAGATFDDVEKYLGFSCIGRFTNAGPPRRTPDGKPCNWTLGGLFQTHTLEVVTPDGNKHRRFELASPAEAQSHRDTMIEQESA